MARSFPDDIAHRLASLCAAYLRVPSGIASDDATNVPVLEFDPPLSTAEQATFAVLLRMARARTDLTLTEWQAVAPAIGTLRTFRQRTQAEWGAMTAAQRDVAIVAGINALIDVLRVQLRD